MTRFSEKCLKVDKKKEEIFNHNRLKILCLNTELDLFKSFLYCCVLWIRIFFFADPDPLFLTMRIRVLYIVYDTKLTYIGRQTILPTSGT